MIKLLASTICFQGTGYFLQLGAFFLFARILGSEGQGILAIFRASGQIIVSFMWLGLPAGIVYFVGKDKNFFLPLLKNCLKWSAFAFSILILLLHSMPINRIPKLNLMEHYIPYLLIFIFLLTFFTLFQGLMLSLKKYVYFNLFAFGLGIIIVTFSVLIGLLPHSHNRLLFAIMAYIIGYGIMGIYGLAVTIFEKYNLKNSAKTLPFLKQFKVGFRGFLSHMAGLLLLRLDLFFVGYFLSFKEVGVYSIALFSAEMITKIPNWSSSILIPMVASNEKSHVRRTVYLFYSSIILAFILGLSFILIITIFPQFISHLIGEDFTGVEVCLLLLLPRVIMQSGVGILGANLAGKGYPWYHPFGTFLAVFFVIVLDIILIPKYGIIGASLANSLAYISAAIVFWIGFHRYNIMKEVSVRSYIDTLIRSVS